MPNLCGHKVVTDRAHALGRAATRLEMTKCVASIACAATLLLGGCGSEGDDSETAPATGGLLTMGSQSGDDGLDSGGLETGDSGGSGMASDTSSDGGPKLDTLPADTGEGGTGESCAKVDLLFVVDNSGSMADEQAKLIANFPGFANEIQTTLADVDSYHVGVVVTDNFGLPFPDGVNNASPECRTHGALVTSNMNGNCGPFAEGHRYMTEMDDLGSAFACAANVGDQGSGYEEVAGSMLAAIGPGINAAGACNEGFIRDDALLVVVLISDENDDIESMGNPADWYALLSTLKFNEPDNVVVLSLLWDDSNGNPFGCQNATDEEYGAAIAEFTQMFTNGSIGNLCADSYQQFFSDAISVIDSACDDFTPPG
jgi:hypothetical protein